MNSEKHPDLNPASGLADKRALRMELLISNLLRVGVVASFTVMLTGIVFTFLHHPAYMSSAAVLTQLTHPGAGTAPHPAAAFAAAFARNGHAIVILGLLLLIATPVLRVAISVFLFFYQKDRVYVLITAVVLCLLLLSFFLGKAGG